MTDNPTPEAAYRARITAAGEAMGRAAARLLNAKAAAPASEIAAMRVYTSDLRSVAAMLDLATVQYESDLANPEDRPDA